MADLISVEHSFQHNKWLELYFSAKENNILHKKPILASKKAKTGQNNTVQSSYSRVSWNSGFG